MSLAPNARGAYTGFTLIELLVVMAILATLLTIGVPRYFASVERSKEAVLRENLRVVRDAIDKYYADNGRYPDTVETLASRRYLRAVPIDPITESATTWVTVAPPEDPGRAGIYDIRSGAEGNTHAGTPYGQL